jgi:glucose-1-phosphate thymidylyltransferase
MEQDLITHGQMDFNLPHDVVPLPSGGIFYKSKKKNVKVGYLTASDENILVNIDGAKTIKESIIGPFAQIEFAILHRSLIGNDALLKGMSQSLNIGDSTEINFG